MPDKRQSENEAGWTLVELMVVLLIIASIVAFAIPAYKARIMSGRLNEAKAMILAIEARQKIYFNQNGAFYPPTTVVACGSSVGTGTTSEVTIRKALGVDLRNSRNFKYQIWAGKNGTCAAPTSLDIGTSDHWFRVMAIILAPGAIDADKGTGQTDSNDDMTLQPEWTTTTDQGDWLIYEYPHRTATNYASQDAFVVAGWNNGFNALRIFDGTDTSVWAYLNP